MKIIIISHLAVIAWLLICALWINPGFAIAGAAFLFLGYSLAKLDGVARK